MYDLPYFPEHGSKSKGRQKIGVAAVVTKFLLSVSIRQGESINRKFPKKSITPNVGLEPTTLRLRVSCSTD